MGKENSTFFLPKGGKDMAILCGAYCILVQQKLDCNICTG